MMNCFEPDLSEAISLFRQKICLYLDDEEIEDGVERARKICRGLRDEGLRRLNASGLSDDDKKSPQFVDFFRGPGGYTTNLAEHTHAFLGKPGSTEPQLAIRVKWYHEAHFRFN